MAFFDSRDSGIERLGADRLRFVDGMSNTVALSEVATIDSSTDIRGAWMVPAMGATLFTARLAPNSRENDRIAACDETLAPDDPLYCEGDFDRTPDVWAAARSYHSGGVNALLADGAVRFINDNIDMGIWQGINTTNNRESVGDF